MASHSHVLVDHSPLHFSHLLGVATAIYLHYGVNTRGMVTRNDLGPEGAKHVAVPRRKMNVEII